MGAGELMVSSLPAAVTAPLLQATLYVGDLDPTVGEGDLAAAFAGFGVGPASARVCRDRLTGGSLRYAYLNFSSFALAYQAMGVMNHAMLKGRPMRIMWSVRDPIARKNGLGNLFVKNLDEWLGVAELEELFKKYGSVVSCKVAMDENGKSKCFGFVQMGSEDGAKSAILALHGKILSGGTKELYVSNFVKKSQRQGLSPQGRNCNNLYVKNLEPDITDDLLQSKFSEFGEVCSAVVMKDELGKSRGFGFVSFELLDQAMKAMEALNGSILGTKAIYVGLAQKKAEREEELKLQFSEKHDQVHFRKTQGSNVYVKYLDDSVDDRALQEFFSQCGQVVSARVMQHTNGMSKGFGFVSFTSPEAAAKAVAVLHGTYFRGKLLYVAIAQRKEERQMVLQNQFANKMPQFSSYSRPVTYPLPAYGQTRNYENYQGYQYLSPVPVYHRQQWPIPQYAPSASSQWQNPNRALYNTMKSIWPLQPTKSEVNMSLGSHGGVNMSLGSQNGVPKILCTPRAPARKVKISPPLEKQKQKQKQMANELKLKTGSKSLDEEVKEAVKLMGSIKLDSAALSTWISAPQVETEAFRGF